MTHVHHDILKEGPVKLQAVVVLARVRIRAFGRRQKVKRYKGKGRGKKEPPTLTWKREIKQEEVEPKECEGVPRKRA